MHGFDAKSTFDPLNKSQAPDGDRFRPPAFFHSGQNTNFANLRETFTESCTFRRFENSPNVEVPPCSVLLFGRFERNVVIERFEQLEPSVLDTG